MTDNIIELVQSSASANPNAAAIQDLDSGETVTYSQLMARVNQTSWELRAGGLEPGVRVALLLTNSPSYLEYFLAAVGAGLVVVPLNSRLTVTDFEHMLSDSGAQVLVTEDGFADVVPQLKPLVEQVINVDKQGENVALPPAVPDSDWVSRSDSDLCSLMYTSGTTGAPKAVMLSHGAWRSVSRTSLELLSFECAPAVLHAAPLTHGAGFMMLPTFAAGGVNLTMRSFDPNRTANLIAGGEVNGLFLVPSMIRMLLDTVDASWSPHSDFRWLYYAGSPIPAETLLEATTSFDGKLVQTFAQMEAPMYLTALSSRDHVAALDPDQRELAGTAGRVIPGRRVEIIDTRSEFLPAGQVGQIVARAPQMMLGYWNRPEATAETIRNGWLHTGDLGFFDEDGLLHVVDRIKDMIVTGGSNVYAKEVEDVLLEAPGVSEVAVVGFPHRIWGEEVAAVVVSDNGHAIDQEAVRTFCRSRLAGYKVPKRLIQVSKLPRNPYGKVLKRMLKTDLAEQMDILHATGISEGPDRSSDFRSESSTVIR